MSEPLENRLRQMGWASLSRALLCALLALLLCSQPTSSAESPSVSEYDLKAAYLYNFAKFTSWPESSFAAAQSPMIVGVLGDQRFIAALETLTRGRLVGGHLVSVKAWSPQLGTAGLHVLYVESAYEAQLAKMAGTFVARGLLTVGETDAFMASGGAIRLVVDGNRLQFEVSTPATERAGLTLSSQLLMLAKSIRKN